MSVSKDIAQQLKNKDLISIRMVKKEDALNYFNINDLDDIYNAVENNQDYFVKKYNNLVNRRV